MSAKSDPVTPELRAQVIDRDRTELIHTMAEHLYCWHEIKVYLQKKPVCVAAILDPSESANCWGRSTLEHVKIHLRMGVRAESDTEHLVTLCEGHTENGRRAGYQWNTVKEHRDAIREYLRRVG